jgi:hypothetical protein
MAGVTGQIDFTASQHIANLPLAVVRIKISLPTATPTCGYLGQGQAFSPGLGTGPCPDGSDLCRPGFVNRPGSRYASPEMSNEPTLTGSRRSYMGPDSGSLCLLLAASGIWPVGRPWAVLFRAGLAYRVGCMPK